jgi:hypothetical protein
VGQLILEISLSVILSPEDMGFYIGPYTIEAENAEGMDATTLIVKLWVFMMQFTVFTDRHKK